MIATEQGLKAYFQNDHRRLDSIWGSVEGAADKGDTAQAATLWMQFSAGMRRHLDMEEKVLFPALEDATGMHGGGPTFVMRSEHTQMRGVMDRMDEAAASGNMESILDEGDTLLMLLQQHNVKEEGILYPMADQFLAGQAADIFARIEKDFPEA